MLIQTAKLSLYASLGFVRFVGEVHVPPAAGIPAPLFGGRRAPPQRAGGAGGTGREPLGERRLIGFLSCQELLS